MATKYKIATALLIFGITCFILFYVIGSEVDEDGYIHEPFALLPLGFISIHSSSQSSITIKSMGASLSYPYHNVCGGCQRYRRARSFRTVAV